MADLLGSRLNEREGTAPAPAPEEKPKKEKKPKAPKTPKPKKEKIKESKPKKEKKEIKLRSESESKKISAKEKRVQRKRAKLEAERGIYDNNLDYISAEEVKKDIKSHERRKRRFQLAKIAMCALCGYLMFLIYGVIVTTYDYDKDGNVTAQIMSRDDIKNQKDFSTLLGYYTDARDLYQKVLILDYRFEYGEEDILDLVPEYESLLDESSRIIVQIRAVSPPKAYSQAYALLLNWVNADISSYLQEISAALAQNSAEHMQNALNDKTRTYNDCYQLTVNIISLGENVKGVNVSDLKEWSPEVYLREELGDLEGIDPTN